MTRTRPRVSILLPVYNEVRTVGRVLATLRRLQPRAELIAIDDGSTDGSARVLASWGARGVRVITHPRNRGKGSAVRTGLARARGRWIVVQDADLETDPRDLPRLLRPLARGGRLAVFGTRFGDARPRPGTIRFTRAANRLITGTVNRLFGARLTDVACAYKAAPAALLRALPLRARRFEFEAELAARLLQRRIRIVEVPVRYAPRTYREGKKIHPIDGLRILATLAWIRLGG
jgi:glycosyltransferase involved in cell wall biosynthesis